MIKLKSSIVFGLAEPKPAKGFPDGRIRWRIRDNEFAFARVKTSDGIREFSVKEEDGVWMPAYEHGRNADTPCLRSEFQHADAQQIRWAERSPSALGAPQRNRERPRADGVDPRIEKYQEPLPECCGLVPVLHRGRFSVLQCDMALDELRMGGSKAAPGFMKPEGIVVFHVAGNVGFKKTIEKDEEPKGAR